MKTQSAVRFMAMVGIAGLALVGTAQAAPFSKTYSQTVSKTILDWTGGTAKNLNFTKFDDTGRTLGMVKVTMIGRVAGDMAAENTGGSAATLTATLRADMHLDGFPDTVTLDKTVTATESIGVTAWDGVTDFGGTSGHTWLDVLGGNMSTNRTLVIGIDDLASFIGTSGFKTFTLTASGSSYATAGGSALSEFTTYANAQVDVTYYYTGTEFPAVPEPTSAMLLILGSCSILIRRRRS